jgi:hypothetical protein
LLHRGRGHRYHLAVGAEADRLAGQAVGVVQQDERLGGQLVHPHRLAGRQRVLFG